MKDLIEKLENARGPDSELDGRIYCAMRGLTFKSVDRTGSIHFEPDAKGTHTMVTPHPYTASIDTALELISDDWAWSLHGGEGRCAGVDLCLTPQDGDDVVISSTEAITTPLCLCVAALKAHVHQQGTSVPK